MQNLEVTHPHPVGIPVTFLSQDISTFHHLVLQAEEASTKQGNRRASWPAIAWSAGRWYVFEAFLDGTFLQEVAVKIDEKDWLF